MAKIIGRYGRSASAHDMYEFLGVKSLPVEGMPEREIQGIRVYVKPLAEDAFNAFIQAHEPDGGWRDLKDARRAFARTRHRNFQGLRVMAICECGQHVPVGRLHQHKCKE